MPVNPVFRSDLLIAPLTFFARDHRRSTQPQHNKSLDASGTNGSLIDNLSVAWLTAAASTPPLGISSRDGMVMIKGKVASLFGVMLLNCVLAPNTTNGHNQGDRLAPHIAWAMSEGQEVNQSLDFTKHLGFGDRQITTIGIAYNAQFEKSEGRYLFEVVKGSEPRIV